MTALLSCCTVLAASADGQTPSNFEPIRSEVEMVLVGWPASGCCRRYSSSLGPLAIGLHDQGEWNVSGAGFIAEVEGTFSGNASGSSFNFEFDASGTDNETTCRCDPAGCHMGPSASVSDLVEFVVPANMPVRVRHFGGTRGANSGCQVVLSETSGLRQPFWGIHAGSLNVTPAGDNQIVIQGLNGVADIGLRAGRWQARFTGSASTVRPCPQLRSSFTSSMSASVLALTCPTIVTSSIGSRIPIGCSISLESIVDTSPLHGAPAFAWEWRDGDSCPWNPISSPSFCDPSNHLDFIAEASTSPTTDPFSVVARLNLDLRSSATPLGTTEFRLRVQNSCGITYSQTILLAYTQADINHDCFVDFFDYDDFVTCFEGSDCPNAVSADFNRDGFIDFFDYDDFVMCFQGA